MSESTTMEFPAHRDRLSELAECVRLPSERTLARFLSRHPALAHPDAPRTRTPDADALGARRRAGLALQTSRLGGLARRLSDALERVGADPVLELLVDPQPGFNAYTFSNPLDGVLAIGVTGQLLEAFEDDEIVYVVGHELGHQLLKHVGGGEKVSRALASLPSTHPLQMVGLSLSRRREISCDRIGWLMSGQADAVWSAMGKLMTGTPNRRFEVEASDLLSEHGDHYAFYDAAIDGYAPWRLTHPPSRLRARALKALMNVASRDAILAGTASLEEANRAADTLLDTLEIDGLKRDKSLVAQFYRSLLVLGRHIAVADGQQSRFESAILDLLSDRIAHPGTSQTVDDACAFLRRFASIGRRIRVLDVLVSVAAVDLCLERDEEQALADVAGRLQIKRSILNARLERLGHALERPTP